jgi:hypothetical protein
MRKVDREKDNRGKNRNWNWRWNNRNWKGSGDLVVGILEAVHKPTTAVALAAASRRSRGSPWVLQKNLYGTQ